MINPKRIVVLGLSGAGKTTFARHLSKKLALPHYELDAWFWMSDWTPADESEFRRKVGQELAAECWIVEGHHGKIADLALPRAEVIFWLDYSFPRICAQLFLRTLKRALLGERLWNGNRESFWRGFLSSKSPILWLFKMRETSSEKFEQVFSDPAFDATTKIRFRSPKESKTCLQSF